MKRLLTILALLMLTTAVGAQTLEKTNGDFPTGYFESSYFNSGNTIKSIDGVLYMVYADTPMVLLRYPAANPRTEFEVPKTVRRIANNAFQGTRYLKTLKMHDEVSFGNHIYIVIGETAFNDSSIENFVVIENNETSATGVAPQRPDVDDRREVARYDLSGRPATDHSTGVQIVRYDDGSASKVLR